MVSYHSNRKVTKAEVVTRATVVTDLMTLVLLLFIGCALKNVNFGLEKQLNLLSKA